jgi:hypothetical protein
MPSQEADERLIIRAHQRLRVTPWTAAARGPLTGAASGAGPV